MAMFEKERQKVQYLGETGHTATCILAINAIINSGIFPEKATIVTNVTNRSSQPIQEDHLFIFWNWQYMPVVIIPSGFASGYPGEGPRGFQLTTCMIKEKGMPLDESFVDEPTFEALDKGKITYTDHQILKNIKLDAEPYGWFNLPAQYENALERGQIWRHSYLEGYNNTDPISLAISNVDSLSPKVGKKLRLADHEIRKGDNTENWQHSGLLVRDSWIELSKILCDKDKIDISDIEKDKVVEKLKRLKINEQLLSLCKASFDLSLKVQHDRKITQEIALACVTSSIYAMQSVTYKYSKKYLEFK
jgi:hypothetical protein